MVKFKNPLDIIFKSLADPNRRAMLVRLRYGEATLGQLAEPLAISLPAVHQHLEALRQAGLVHCEKRGRERWCRLELRALEPAQLWIDEHQQMWGRRLAALDDYLSEPIQDRRSRSRQL